MIKWGKELENQSPKEIIEFAINNIPGKIVFLTAFGPEGCVIMHMIHELLLESKILKTEIAHLSLDPSKKSDLSMLINLNSHLAIANLDTGYQFKETLDLKDKLEAKYGFIVDMVTPEITVEEQDAKYMKNLYEKYPDQCCYLRKVLPLEKLLTGKGAWITAIRRDQTEHRANAMPIEFDPKFQIGKINPLVKWSKSDVWKYIHENKIPYNILLDQGYDSIGCQPCTQPGEGRSGRWAGKDKIECGLHIQEKKSFEQELHGGENI